MSAVTSSPLPLSAEWIPTLLQMSKEVRKRVNGEGETRAGVGEKREGYQGLYKRDRGGQ